MKKMEILMMMKTNDNIGGLAAAPTENIDYYCYNCCFVNSCNLYMYL